MRRMLFPLFVMLFVWSTISLALEAKQKVSSVGMSVIHNNFKDIARDKAIDNALRAAVERVAGVMVSSSTEVENFQVKMDSILSESRGFVESYKIVSEKQDGANYEVKIEAEIGAGKLEDRMKAIDLIVQRKSKPRLMIVFAEQAQKDAVAEAAMSKYFMAKGFKLVDASIINKGRSDLKLGSTSGNEKVVSLFARKIGAEIVILGTVEVVTNSFMLSGIEMFTNRVNISVKVINGDTGDLITTDSEFKSAPGPKGDFKGIAEGAAGKLAGKIFTGTIERWSSELTNALTVKLIVSGLDDYQNLVNFKDQLPLVVKGFRSLYQRAYANGELDMDIEFRGETQGLADDLSAMTVKDRKINIVEITPNRIAVKLMP